MKFFFIILTIIVCFFSNGCSSLPSQQNNPNATLSERDNYNPHEPLSFIPLESDWSNYRAYQYDASMALGIGASVDQKGIIVPLRKTSGVCEKGSFTVFLKTFWGLDKYDVNGKYHMTLFVTINKNPVDFSIESKKSKDGILQVDATIGEYTIYKIQFDHFNAMKGINTISVYGVIYVPQIGNCFCLFDSGQFYSDNHYVGNNANHTTLDEITDVSKEYFAELTSDEMNDLKMNSSSLVEPQYIKPHSGNVNCFDISSGVPMNFSFLNTKNDKPHNCSGFCLVFRNGVPFSAWNGNTTLLKLDILEEEVTYRIPIKHNLPVNEYSLIEAIFFECNDNCEDSIPQIYIQRELFYIRE